MFRPTAAKCERTRYEPYRAGTRIDDESIMSGAQIIWVLALALALSAAWTDWRTRKIPNWLTVPALLLGVTIHTVIAGWPGAKTSLEGAGLALALLLPLVLLRGLGAGDWKLMGALGAFLGPVLLLYVLLGSVLVSGLMAMVEVTRTRRVRETMRNLYVLVRGFLSFGLRKNPEISLDNPGLLKLPFGVAVAAATVICYCAARWAI
jgi:prepilin peptidase CpaA